MIWWNQKKAEIRRLHVESCIDTILYRVIDNAHKFTELEQGEIIETVLSRFKEHKIEKHIYLTKEAKTIKEVLKQIKQDEKN